MPINKIKNPTDMQQDLLRATVFILSKHDLDVKNSHNIVRVLSGMYHVNDLEKEILYVARSLDGLQGPDVSQIISPDRTRTNELGQDPYYIRMPGLSYTATRTLQKQEEYEIERLQYEEPELGAPREDLKVRKLVPDDPDIEGDPDLKKSNLPEDLNSKKPRDYMQFLSEDEADQSATGTYHDRYDEAGEGMLQSGVIYCSFKGPVRSEIKKQAAIRFVAKLLNDDLQTHRKQNPNAKILSGYWQLPHKIAAIAESFNQVHADPDEYAISYAISKGQ